MTINSLIFTTFLILTSIISRVMLGVVLKLENFLFIVAFCIRLRSIGVITAGQPCFRSFNSGFLQSCLADKTHYPQLSYQLYLSFGKDPLIVLVLWNGREVRCMGSGGPLMLSSTLTLRSIKPLMKLGTLSLPLANPLLEPSLFSVTKCYPDQQRLLFTNSKRVALLRVCL